MKTTIEWTSVLVLSERTYTGSIIASSRFESYEDGKDGKVLDQDDLAIGIELYDGSTLLLPSHCHMELLENGTLRISVLK